MARFGQRAFINFKGSRTDGTVFDSNDGEEPLGFIIGNAEVIPGIERAVMDMAIGEERTLFIPHEDAYGEFQPEMVREIPVFNMPNSHLLEAGIVIKVSSDNLPTPSLAQVVKIEKGMIYLDFNHPLAGEDLEYTVSLIDVQDK